MVRVRGRGRGRGRARHRCELEKEALDPPQPPRGRGIVRAGGGVLSDQLELLGARLHEHERGELLVRQRMRGRVAQRLDEPGLGLGLLGLGLGLG